MNIEWIEKTNIAHRIDKDVSIRVILRDKVKNHYRSVITFRNQADKKITHTEYMMCGISINRIYFNEGILNHGGFKCTRAGNNITISLPAVLKEFVGDYDLQYDVKEELYYIEREEKDGE